MDLKLKDNLLFSLGSTISSNITSSCTTAYVKDCPNVSGINILRQCINLTRVRLDIGNVTSSLQELLSYSIYGGFNDNYEEQAKPRLVGTWTINYYYTNAMLAEAQAAFDGLTIVEDTTYNWETMLSNDLVAVQTIDDTAPNYNPAVAIILNNNNRGNVCHSPLIQGGGRFYISKAQAAVLTGINTWFRDITSVTDANGIVTSDTTDTYRFEEFNEFKYWTGLTTITAGNSTASKGAFGDCTALTSIEIPEGVTSIGAFAFHGCSALNRIVIPSTLTSTGDVAFSSTSAMNGGSVYFNGTLNQWLNINFGGGTNTDRAGNPASYGAHFYINGEELTSLIIPDGITTIKGRAFYGMKYITDIVIPNTVTSIQIEAFKGCSSLKDLILPTSVTSVGNYALNGLISLKNLVVNDFKNSYLGTSTSVTIGSANYEGDMIVRGDMSISAGNGHYLGWYYRFKTIYVYGNISASALYVSYLIRGNNNLRVKGNITSSTCYHTSTSILYDNTHNFAEIIGNVTSNSADSRFGTAKYHHYGYSTVISSTPTQMSIGSSVTKIYVGDGTSRSNDEAVLALYLADTNWSAYSAKLGTWYGYNGDYKWYYITDNLTNCTNTNSDEWPHITRGDSYETTIVPDEGMTLGTVTVEMLDTDKTSGTYDTMVDITSSVYDSSTGEINIPSVTGNVVITAIAS